MSDQAATDTSSEVRKSSERILVEIYVLACGHGDTILVSLPDERWALVDCNLPDTLGIRDRFFQFIESRGIKRLDIIFQTHPDYDHFHGMIEVLDYFSQDDRSFGLYCDGGLGAQQVRSLIWGDFISEGHYAKLQRRLDEVDPSKYREVGDGYQAIPGILTRKHGTDAVSFIPISPNPGIKRQTARSDIRRIAANPDARVKANALSVVLVLAIRKGAQQANVLLTADADRAAVDLALDAWANKAGETGHEPKFDVIKIPHHGSIESHSSRLCQAGRKDRDCCVAAASVGEQYDVLPDREVLREYLDAGWTVLVTTGRRGAVRGDRPGKLADRGPRRVMAYEPHTVRITLSADGVDDYGPESAAVHTRDLPLYDSASG